MSHAHSGASVEHAPCSPHQITIELHKGGRETYTCGDLSVTQRADAMRSLLRLMVQAGMSGAAEVRGTDGKLRMTVRDIAASARFVLSEEDRDGFRLRPYTPELPGRTPTSALSVRAGSEASVHA